MNKIRFYAGPHAPHTDDFVMNRSPFINEKTMNEYDYTISETTQKDGHEIYKIRFTPTTIFGTLQGYFYLDATSNAFLRARYKLTKEGVRQSQQPFSGKRLDGEAIISYVNRKGKWVLQNSWWQVSIR